jgi:hypothetical protein
MSGTAIMALPNGSGRAEATGTMDLRVAPVTVQIQAADKLREVIASGYDQRGGQLMQLTMAKNSEPGHL